MTLVVAPLQHRPPGDRVADTQLLVQRVVLVAATAGPDCISRDLDQVVGLEALAEEVCTSLDDFPLTTGVLGCSVFEQGEGYTAIREGLRRDELARYRFTLAHEVSEILLRRYLNSMPERPQREHVCDAFAAELLLPHAAVLASVAVLMQAHAGGPGPSEATLEQLARRIASTYDVSLTAAGISIAECL